MRRAKSPSYFVRTIIVKHEYVLRPIEKTSGGEIRFGLGALKQIQTGEDATHTVSILRRDENGFATILFGERVVCGFIDPKNGEITLTLDGRPETFSLRPAALDAMRQGLLQSKKHSGPIDIKSPIPGTIKALMIEVNATVAAGQTLGILEAMKMENEIRAPHAGVVERICVTSGQNVAAGALLFTIKV